jgi:hypothetical protein
MAEKPTPEIEAQGLKAYEQARAFERIRAWRLPVTFTVPPIILVLVGAMAWHQGYLWLCAVSLSLALFAAVRLWLQWKRLLRLYGENLALLARLESTYGDALPWVQVEQHFAALEELKREIAEGRNGPTT